MNKLAGVRNYLAAAGEAIASGDAQPCADQSGVEGQLRMEVHVAEQHLIGVRPARVRGVHAFVRHFLGVDPATKCSELSRGQRPSQQSRRAGDGGPL